MEGGGHGRAAGSSCIYKNFLVWARKKLGKAEDKFSSFAVLLWPELLSVPSCEVYSGEREGGRGLVRKKGGFEQQASAVCAGSAACSACACACLLLPTLFRVSLHTSLSLPSVSERLEEITGFQFAIFFSRCAAGVFKTFMLSAGETQTHRGFVQQQATEEQNKKKEMRKS